MTRIDLHQQWTRVASAAILAATTWGAAPASAQQEGTVFNGDFSQQLSGWRTQADQVGDATFEIDDEALKIHRKADGYFMRAYQDVQVHDSQGYTLTCRMKVQGGGSGRMWVIVHTTEEGGKWRTANQDVIRSDPQRDTRNAWERVSLQIPAVKGMDQLRLDFAPYGENTTLWVDDVQLSVPGQTPGQAAEPTATAPKAPVPRAVLRGSDFFASADTKLTFDQIVAAERPYAGRHTWADYQRLIDELSQDRYQVVPLREFSSTAVAGKVLVGLRHDIDSHPERSLVAAEMEEKAGLRSTFYVLHSAAYYGQVRGGRMVRNAALDKVVEQLHRRGFEIGIHTDLFSMMWDYQFDPVGFIREEIAYYQGLGVPVVGAAAHGAHRVIQQKLNNVWVFSDFGRAGEVAYDGRTYSYGRSGVADFGLMYEAYLLPQDLYTGDIDPRVRHGNAPIDEIISLLAGLQPGQRAIILTHPEHWGKAQAS